MPIGTPFNGLPYLKESASQTAGPYVHIGLMPNYAGIPMYGGADPGNTIFGAQAKGDSITISGFIYDGTGTKVRDAVVECWQADGAGIYHPDQGWGRSACDAETGRFEFQTVKPGPVPFPDGRLQAPHVTLYIVARGINMGLNTRIYFADEAEANDADPVLSRIEHKGRIETLLAQPEADGYRFDIRLQGEGETIFFDL